MTAWTGALLGAALVLWMVEAGRAQGERDRLRVPAVQVQPGREPEQPPAEGRPGGIPRNMLAPEGRTPSKDGVEEGVPQLQVQPRAQGAAPYWIPPASDWKLGVYAYNTETGVVIARVLRDSAAARAGLEAGDRIVNVGGYQVGYVGDMLFPLGYELQRQAGPRGVVLLLVQNVRGAELINVDARLDRSVGYRPPRIRPE
jgi:hypothetical protein